VVTEPFDKKPIPAGHIPTWVGVGGSPQSVVRAARFGLPLMLAVIAGSPERFAPYVELYKRALEQYSQPELPIGLHSLGFVADTDEDANRIQWPYYKEQFERAARERGWRPPTYEQFQAEVDHGSMYVGSPETVAHRIADAARTLSLSRFDLHYAIGRVPHEQRLATIGLYGREVIPRVRELLAATPEAAPVAASFIELRRRSPRTSALAKRVSRPTTCASASSARASSARHSRALPSRPVTTS